MLLDNTSTKVFMYNHFYIEKILIGGVHNVKKDRK
jgi:hypothetical protein